MKTMKERTKWMFANAILDIINKKELSKIRICELCEYCGTDRQTFYYHFKDKYDLVAWIYEQDLKYSFEQYNNYFSKDQTSLLLKRIKEKHFFYRKAFEDTNQNSLFSYMRAANLRITEDILKHHLQVDELTEEQLFSINYHSYAWVCCLSEWLKNRCEPELNDYVDYLYDNSVFIYKQYPFQKKAE